MAAAGARQKHGNCGLSVAAQGDAAASQGNEVFLRTPGNREQAGPGESGAESIQPALADAGADMIVPTIGMWAARPLLGKQRDVPGCVQTTWPNWRAAEPLL